MFAATQLGGAVFEESVYADTVKACRTGGCPLFSGMPSYERRVKDRFFDLKWPVILFALTRLTTKNLI